MTPEAAFDQYHQAVYRFVYRFTRSPDAAEDITQECFLALLRTPGRYQPSRGGMQAYLFAIARNLALKRYRDFRNEHPLEACNPPAAPDPRPALDIASAVEAAVAALPALQREALILFEYEGVTLEEIATIVDADAGAVKSRLYRARERLRRALAEYRTRSPRGTSGS